MPFTRSPRPLIALLALGILAVGLLAPSGARAMLDVPAGPQTWAVAPASVDGPDGRSAFEYVAEPGDTYTDHVAVRNLGEEPLTVTLYAQDAVQTVDGGFEVLTPDEGGDRIGAWIDLDGAEITVPPRENIVVPFAMTIPADAPPGDHPGGIVAVSMPREGDGALVQYRVGARLHLRVAGPVDAALEVDSLHGSYETRWALFAPSPLHVDATFENTGNIRLTPQARVHVHGLFGWWSTSAPLDGLEEILPGGVRSSAAHLPEVPPIGPLWVSVEMTQVRSAGQDVTDITTVASRTVVMWAIPWMLLAVVVLLLPAAAVAVVNIRRRRRSSRENTRTPHPLS